ncbi:hypothetical protein F5984_13420 [Rudanella paleaurantiibacter]|uniref:Lipopolysaccharide biosynthesis protein n=1 Tax=Rudanella paleaurantiibacter TaxID=2614655 RepID=A0A7J5TYI7_9BACT|nr:hypothetical protein [Rudanella paleaurantiibacter]KAB7730174.1 hypothetical protein F5984_13420 [Rudanella paleaurantiibacter]
MNPNTPVTNMSEVPAPLVRPVPPDQLSPKAVVLQVFKLKHVFKRYWKLILVLMVLGGVIGKIIDISEERKPVYNGGITFNLGGGGATGGGLGELGALAGAFGLGSSAPDANIFVGDNFMIYAKSRPVVEKTLMKTVKINGKDTLLVNYYIVHSGIRDKEWEDSDTLRTLTFDRAKKPEEYNKQEILAMSQVYARIATEMAVSQPERKSSFMRLTAAMEDEALTKVFVETHLKTIEEDYREKQTKKTREMYTLLKERTDSLYRVMTGTERQLARQIDQNQQVVAAQAQIQETRLTRNSTFLSQQYFAALQQQDNMRLSLIKEAPLFTEIEPVSLPLYKEIRTSIAMQAGIVLGLIISLLIVFVRETYRSVMQEG